LLTSLPCDPATAKRTRGKGAAGASGGGRAAAPLAARPAQAVAAPCPALLPSPPVSRPFLRMAPESAARGREDGVAARRVADAHQSVPARSNVAVSRLAPVRLAGSGCCGSRA